MYIYLSLVYTMSDHVMHWRALYIYKYCRYLKTDYNSAFSN